MFSRNKFYDVVKIRDHKSQKQRILDAIDTREEHTFENISNTDWTGDPLDARSFDWFSECFSERDTQSIGITIFKKYQQVCKIKNCWYNQYYPGTGSTHQPHDHPESDLTLIYFVELSNRNLATNLYHPLSGKMILPRVKEGDVLIMPAKIWHSSPPNYTDSRKTVVSVNLDFKINK